MSDIIPTETPVDATGRHIEALADSGFYTTEIGKTVATVFNIHTGTEGDRLPHNADFEACHDPACLLARTVEAQAAAVSEDTIALVNRILDVLEQQGLATWGCLPGDLCASRRRTERTP